MTTLTLHQIIAKAARLLGDIKFYEDYNEAQRAAVNEICLSTSLTHERALALWDVVDPVGAVIAEDNAANPDRRLPELNKVQQVAYSGAYAIADEVCRQVGRDLVSITIEVSVEGTALAYHVRPANDSSRCVVMGCSDTPLEALAQMAALIVKRK